jgi:beta-lactamase class D
LNASARAQALVRDILKIETRDGATLYAKTGWASPGPPAIGWWTGWVERAGAVHGFSLNIDMPDIAGAPKRPEISRAILSALQVY